MNPFTPQYLSLALLSSQYLQSYLGPPIHPCVHSSLLPRDSKSKALSRRKVIEGVTVFNRPSSRHIFGPPFIGSALAKKMTEDFGSYEAWEKDFKTTGSMRGIGWTVLYQDSVAGKLYNFWINEHDVSHPAGCNPILILDVFEHAFMIDYGLKRADYIEAFFKNIDWMAASARTK